MKKIKEENVIDDYEVGKLSIIVQAVKDAKTGRIIKGVFCGLDVKKDDKKEKLNFVFSLDSAPSFKKHIVSMINEAIKLKTKEEKIKCEKKTKK